MKKQGRLLKRFKVLISPRLCHASLRWHDSYERRSFSLNAHSKIKTTVYTLLARREYSSFQIEQKLIKKGFEAGEVELVLGQLAKDGTVSDQRYVESYLRYRQAQGYGPLRIQQELFSHGISKEMIEDQLNIADNAWFAEAKRVWQKRFRAKPPTDLKDRGKQLRFLQYRGFTPEQIKQIYNYDFDNEP